MLVDVHHVAKRRIDTDLLAAHAALSQGVARWLGAAQLKGIGVDMLSVDEVADAVLPMRLILLAPARIIGNPPTSASFH